MAKKLSNVQLMPAVEGISRKFALRRETCYSQSLNKGSNENNKIVIPGHTYMGVISREVTVFGYGTATKNRLFMRKPMLAPLPTQPQAQARLAFGVVSGWCKDAKEDLSAISVNQQRFLDAKNDLSKKIHGVSAMGYQTYEGWLFAVAIALYNDNALPQEGHTLPAFDA